MHTVEKQALNVSPNPSSTIITITTQVTNTNKPTELKVTDILGNIILTKILIQNYDKTLLPVADLDAGLYQCTIYQDGKAILNSKLAVIH